MRERAPECSAKVHVQMADVRRVWIKRIREERKARGWDKPEMARQLAHAADVARSSLPSHESLLSYVKRWERGDVDEISERYQLLYARALGMSEEAIFGEDGDDVDRRGFVGSSLAATFALAVPASVGASSGRRISADTVARLRSRTARLRRLDDVLGGADTYRVYLDELGATTALVDDASYTDAVGRALLGVIAEQAQQAGWSAFDAGWQALAHRHFKDSLTAASDAGDTSLIANALAFLAYQKISTGKPGTGEADAACRVTDSHETPPTVRALLYERAAWAHAVAGDADAANEALHRAREALAGEPPSGTDWAVWVDHTELEIMSGRCWSTLGDHARAVPALQRALDRYDDTHARDKALYLTWLADAHLDAGEIEQAATVTGRALALCADVSSVRPHDRIAATLHRLQPHRDVSAVADVVAEAEELLRKSPGSPSPGMPPSRREA
jgi:transcriptional regulator with XRE-family HTH domain